MVLIVLLVGCWVVWVKGCGVSDHKLSRSFCLGCLGIC